MFVDIEAALEIDASITVSDVILTFAYDDMSTAEANVRYETITAALPGAPPIRQSLQGMRHFEAAVDGTSYWCVSQRSQTSGFALAVHSLPLQGSPAHALLTTCKTAGQAHHLVSEHRFAGTHSGARLLARERKIITAGGFYDEPDSYAAMLARYSQRAGDSAGAIDLSISYDYGAEAKAFARCFRSLAGTSPPIDDPALRDELRGLFDHFHAVYQNHFIAPFRSNASTIFSRSIAFMAFAYLDMLAATNDFSVPHRAKGGLRNHRYV